LDFNREVGARSYQYIKQAKPKQLGNSQNFHLFDHLGSLARTAARPHGSSMAYGRKACPHAIDDLV